LTARVLGCTPRSLTVFGAAYRSALLWLGTKGAFNWLGPRVFAPLDTWLYPRMHGAIVSAGPPVLPLLMLTTTGRTSARIRSVPLLYMRSAKDLIVVASNWGQAQQPAWSDNLLSHPRASIQIGRDRREVQAVLVAPDEKARLWSELVEFCPVWQTYTQRSGRDLRVFVLRPRC
jgi:deazaflavin-dependent oxidoreductase (nitroreductase family)